jgi:hypothetical protein
LKWTKILHSGGVPRFQMRGVREGGRDASSI